MNQSTRKHKCEEEPCMCLPGLLILQNTSAVPHETSFVLVRDSDRPGSVHHNDEDMSELVPCVVVHAKELNLKHLCWPMKEGKHFVAEGCRKEMESLVEDMNAWVLVSLGG